jgi:protein-S-isoprenylcysteine O-methyltransferase Ste14
MSFIEIPLPTGELILRIILLSGLVLHKVVWEVMKKGEKAPKPEKQTVPRSLKSLLISLVKLGKMFFLGFLIVQTIALNVLPIEADVTGIRIVGIIIYIGGLALAISGRVQLGKNWANLEDYQVLSGQSLVQSGIYRYIRHPIYGGDILLVLGLELALNSWLFLVVIPLALVVCRQAKAEESLLAKKMPEYRAYQAGTKMFVPFVF